MKQIINVISGVAGAAFVAAFAWAMLAIGGAAIGSRDPITQSFGSFARPIVQTVAEAVR